jgi:hypothetical protein
MTIIPSDFTRAYQNLAADPRFQHFVRIPDRIVQCIDYFGIKSDSGTIRPRLLSYYLFIGVVDEAIDSGNIDIGRRVLEYLADNTPRFDEATRHSSVKLTTEMLKSHISNEAYSIVVAKLRELYGQVVSERVATSIGLYISHRRSVGALTAELSYLLIRADLNEKSEPLCDFMKQVGAVGCLIDSLIDLKKDRGLGLLAFQPRMLDYIRLSVSILRDGLRVSFKHPRLYVLFCRAVVDNLRDPFRGLRASPRSSFAKRKDEAASVA